MRLVELEEIKVEKVKKNSHFKLINSNYISEITVFIALFFIWVGLSTATPYFFEVKNIMSIGLFAAIKGISATAMTMAVLSAGIDLSVGSVMGLSGMVVAIVASKTDNLFLIIGSGLVTGILCGSLNGLIVTKGKISSFITTISTLLIFRGMAFILMDGGAVIISNDALKWFGRGYIFNIIPVPFILMILCFLIIGFILAKTEFGRNIYAVGGNDTASFLAGIPVNRTRFFVFVTSGFMAGFAGLIIAAQSGAGLPQAADGWQMDIIAAVILGGASLNGGKGKLIGTFLGIILLQTLSNGMTLLNIPSFWQMLAKGSVLILAVVLDVARNGGYKKHSY